MTDETPLQCEVCREEEGVGVAAIPGVPASVAYGRKCLEANAHPMWALVGNTAAMYSGEGDTLEGTDVEWQRMVFATLDHLDISREEFDKEVREAAAEMAEMFTPTIEEELLYAAWGIIVNVDWDKQSEEWQQAAKMWRDRWHDLLAQNPDLQIGELEGEGEEEE